MRPFGHPPDRPETCENLKKTTDIIGKPPKTTKIYQNHKKTTTIALARSPVAQSGPKVRPVLLTVSLFLPTAKARVDAKPPDRPSRGASALPQGLGQLGSLGT